VDVSDRPQRHRGTEIIPRKKVGRNGNELSFSPLLLFSVPLWLNSGFKSLLPARADVAPEFAAWAAS
jgi:hypothetical protein